MWSKSCLVNLYISWFNEKSLPLNLFFKMLEGTNTWDWLSSTHFGWALFGVGNWIFLATSTFSISITEKEKKNLFPQFVRLTEIIYRKLRWTNLFRSSFQAWKIFFGEVFKPNKLFWGRVLKPKNIFGLQLWVTGSRPYVWGSTYGASIGLNQNVELKILR